MPNFGAKDEYAWVIELVRNDSETSGATVRVNSNPAGRANSIITSASQTEAFSRHEELLATAVSTAQADSRTSASTANGVAPTMCHRRLGRLAARQPEPSASRQVVRRDHEGERHVRSRHSDHPFTHVSGARPCPAVSRE